MDLFDLSRYMGTSIAMLDATYGHLRARHAEHNRALLDAFDGVYGLNADSGGGK